jgi:radical SAM protein with 4Fe4S-binding SPASM domain
MFTNYLSAEFPSQINIDLSEFCNLKCIHCPYEQVTKIKGSTRENLDYEIHRKLINEISENENYCKYIRYTGEGEPLLHPRLLDILEYAKNNTKTTLTITTNGQLLTEKIIAKILSYIDIFDISIDAFSEETYEKIRVGGKFKIVKENVNNLIKHIKNKKLKNKTMVSFVEQEQNKNEASDFKSYWKNQGVDFVVIRSQHSCAGSIKKIKDKMWDNINKNNIKRKPCLYPWERLMVTPRGMVTYCPADWLHEHTVGNLKKETIKEIWKGKKMIDVRKFHESNNFPETSLCKTCPDWCNIKWPNEGRSYATVVHEFQDL